MKLRISFLSSILLVTLVTALQISGSACSPPKDQFLGISPNDLKYYKSSSSTLKCKDGSRSFNKNQLNDDFCDCPDGTDEPGTSACPYGKFYCGNAGHMPIFIFSSRVNDGICDCCDGSDEYDGQVHCPNTCWEAGRVARERLNKKIATYREGVGIRKKEIEQVKLAISKDELELSKLKSEEKILKGLVQQLKERKEQIEKAEEEERLKKEKEAKEKNETEIKDNQDEKKADEDNLDEKHETEEMDRSEDKETENLYDRKTGTMEDDASEQSIGEEFDDVSTSVQDGVVSTNKECRDNNVEKCAVEEKESLPVEGKEGSAAVSETDDDAGSKESPKDVANKENDGSADALSKEELGRLVASRWTGENAEKKRGEGGHSEDDHIGNQGQELQNEDNDGYASETDDENLRSDDDDLDDRAEEALEEDHLDRTPSYTSDHDDETDLSDTTHGNPSWLEKIQQTVRNIIRRVKFFQKPVDLSEAAHVRKEYDGATARLSKMQARISSLERKLKHDFGQEKEYYLFYNHCFESKQNKYVYKICPFKQATQEEGYTTTRLGQWDKFEDSYRMMVFSNGDRCWNGPDRSLKVKLRCGLSNEITDVDEPSRCEYVALLSTPAVCTEEKLKELQDKLDAMNKEQPLGHDEL